MDSDKLLSVCIPTYNRAEFTIRAFEQIIDDRRVGEVVISDDHSDINEYYRLELKTLRFPDKWRQKIRLERNEKNLDCYLNKRRAVSLSKNEYCVLFDSDNILTVDYIDVLYHHEWMVGWDKTTILTPEFARPEFDFRWLTGTLLDKSNVARYIDQGNCETMLNAANYFVNRDQYLKVFDNSIDPVTSDSIFMAYNWLKGDNAMFVVPGLQYDHTIHTGSHYQLNNKRTPVGFHEDIKKKLREMR